MPAIFHNSTAADSSTNTAARPASASPLRPPPRAPSAWPRPRGPRLHGCPSGVHLSTSSRDVLCLSSRHMWPLSSAVSVLSAPTSGPKSVCHFPGTPPPPSVQQSSQYPPPRSVSLVPTSPLYRCTLWLPASRLPVWLSVCPTTSRRWSGGWVGEGPGCCLLPLPQQTRLPRLWIPSEIPDTLGVAWPSPSLLPVPSFSPLPSSPGLPALLPEPLFTASALLSLISLTSSPSFPFPLPPFLTLPSSPSQCQALYSVGTQR